MMDETARQRLHLQCPSTGDIEHQKEKLKDKINYHVYETREFHEWTKLRADGKIETLPGNIKYTVCALLEEVENAQRFLAELENFQKRNNHQFGFVVAGSGFRQTYPAICHGTEPPMDASMDWALIDIPEERLGENVVSLNDRVAWLLSVLTLLCTMDPDRIPPRWTRDNRSSNHQYSQSHLWTLKRKNEHSP